VIEDEQKLKRSAQYATPNAEPVNIVESDAKSEFEQGTDSVNKSDTIDQHNHIIALSTAPIAPSTEPSNHNQANIATGNCDSSPNSSLTASARLWLLLRRTIALAIDQVICTAIVALMTVPPLFVWFYLDSGAPLEISNVAGPVFRAIAACIALCGIFVQLFFYCAKFESSQWQATPGKLIMGLRVTDIAGNKMSFGSVSDRLIKQSLLFSGIALVSSYLLAFIWPKSQLDCGLFAVGICFVMSLFSRRGQTLVDICTRRIVAVDNWSLRKTSWQSMLKSVPKILLQTQDGKRDKLIAVGASITAINALLAVLTMAITAYAMSEANKAPWQTIYASKPVDASKIVQDSHYSNATRLFRSPGTIYFMGKNWRKASLTLQGWLPHYKYALELEARKELTAAAREMSQAIALRKLPPNNESSKPESVTALLEDRDSANIGEMGKFLNGENMEQVTVKDMESKLRELTTKI